MSRTLMVLLFAFYIVSLCHVLDVCMREPLKIVFLLAFDFSVLCRFFFLIQD